MRICCTVVQLKYYIELRFGALWRICTLVDFAKQNLPAYRDTCL